MSERKEIIFWDDAGILFTPPDSMEKIVKDAKKVFEEYNNRETYPFDGLIQFYQEQIAYKRFLMKLIIITTRIDRIAKRKKN